MRNYIIKHNKQKIISPPFPHNEVYLESEFSGSTKLIRILCISRIRINDIAAYLNNGCFYWKKNPRIFTKSAIPFKIIKYKLFSSICASVLIKSLIILITDKVMATQKNPFNTYYLLSELSV